MDNRMFKGGMNLIVLVAGLGIGVSNASADLVLGVTNNGVLISFEASNPSAILSGVAISGLQVNEQIRGIDIRPATGELFALGSSSRLYTINRHTGVAMQVGIGPFQNMLNGSSFGFDFNPTIDRIRVVSNADQNLVLNPNDGTSTQVTPLFYATGDVNEGINPNVVGSAYTNNFAGALTSQLYGIDTGLDVLVRQANSAGTLETVGSLGVDLTDVVGFDISGRTGIAYASVLDVMLSRTTFWSIDLMTGQAMSIGEIGGGSLVTAMTVIPTPGGVAIGSIAGLALLRRRRR
ncbi:MAG: DUF4394 domain-containing protein [Phycisphaeraceae bacterium]|nr:DUF4394 domain-containing protein [Phycisphaeraceae bacterium]MCW5763815.1 DUF4394 domain-containing protein [Phycisphaeraceae bacterium]